MHELKLGAREYDYYPPVFGNDEEKKLFKARLRLITTDEYESALRDGTNGMIDRRAIVKGGLIEISDLKVDGKEIKTLEDIMETPGLFVLYADLFVEIHSKAELTEEEAKN